MSDDLTWLPAWRIRELIGKGDVSPVEVVDHFLGRIEELDPKLQAFAHLDADGAREQAQRAERAVARGDELGPLHGLPTAVKEHIAVEGMPRLGLMFAGGGAPKVSSRDDFGIERLRKAGAIIVGTNTMMASGATLSMGDTPGVFEGFNWDVEARNPWDTSKVPGWSSAGGAASAAAGLLPFTIGSDGGGSTRLPAAYSGVVGVHPTGNLMPEVDYSAPSLPSGTTIGPLARSVRDCAIVTQVMAGPDGRDPFCLPIDPPSYLEHLDDGVDGWRFAWTDDFGYGSVYASPDSPEVIETVRTAAMGLSSLGATVEVTDEVWEDWTPHQMTTAAAFAPAFPGMEKPGPEQLQAAFELRARNVDRFRRIIGPQTLLLSPTSQRVARSVEEWNAAWTTEGHTYHGGSFAPTYTALTAMFNWLKFPALSVPCGFVDGLPVGLQIIGLPGSEDAIFRAAQAFQQAFPREERPPVS
ncbi:MAG TPA: amidase [Acidimicrobiia bacterium]|nr:amidase [Acidimicrobiia bacterium]